ncbi:hypothetical protein [Uliginosibacterium sp. sgz301328]|uniref:hypothetical protein n=1 Tax=Uliginosibacterium sp. sgz301328 TaxID=3243764 RepID=UPI0035A0F0E8
MVTKQKKCNALQASNVVTPVPWKSGGTVVITNEGMAFPLRRNTWGGGFFSLTI